MILAPSGAERAEHRRPARRFRPGRRDGVNVAVIEEMDFAAFSDIEDSIVAQGRDDVIAATPDGLFTWKSLPEH